ncbi:hypothetical protein ADL01_12175 [Streptomyces sp. NRRL WC-3618]|uniref:hypothetical protein n=1 Tax=Streptomyces sp. NRRL WC-3618 TaxID=1519490 RepID=UPI0006AF6FE1|nr:hypothetical protein [Streptomyces sp. NRRL WC-3618]KOV80455.1 hypothetical protein ADL01_12175 [Streptomyces sp. NRRL WC-3618]
MSFTQLAFAGPLAHQLKRRAGELGFVVHNRSGPASRSRARPGTTPCPEGQTVAMPVGPGQLCLFSMPRTWQRKQRARVLALPPLSPLPAPAQELLGTFTAA